MIKQSDDNAAAYELMMNEMACKEIITLEKLKLYEKCNGDFDRCIGSIDAEANPMVGESFDTIGGLMRKVHFVKSFIRSLTGSPTVKKP